MLSPYASSSKTSVSSPNGVAISPVSGIVKLATLSTGEVKDQCQPLKRFLPKLAKLQRRLAKRQKFSKNWRKAKAFITKLHTKVANVRKDFVHKASHDISKNHVVVVIEDLQVNEQVGHEEGGAKV